MRPTPKDVIHEYLDQDPPSWCFGDILACGFLACIIAAIVLVAAWPEAR